MRLHIQLYFHLWPLLEEVFLLLRVFDRTLQQKWYQSNEIEIYAFFINNTRLKLAKNQAKAKQHPQAELLLLENFSLSLSTLSSKIRKYCTKCAKKVSLF